MTPTSIVAYLALFTTVGLLFLFVHLVMGKFIRPSSPNKEKLEVYECGEPTIGSSFVQFDIRFYVVALLFIIFDVEVAFFFPWATVFGKTTHLMDPHLAGQADAVYNTAVAGTFRELGVPNAAELSPFDPAEVTRVAGQLAWTSLGDILVFFAVLMVGFAYVWKRGDLDWVRAVSRERSARPPQEPPTVVEKDEPLLVG